MTYTPKTSDATRYGSISHGRYSEFSGLIQGEVAKSYSFVGANDITTTAQAAGGMGEVGSFRCVLEWPATRTHGSYAKATISVTVGNGQTFSRTQWLYQPPSVETLEYDDDGNLIEDARWLYTWDAENRLIAMEEKDVPGDQPARALLEFAYDHQSRRIAKTVKRAADETLQSRTLFLYDGWNLVAELEVRTPSSISNLPTSQPELLRNYAWGLDLSETETGAGGVGGLLLYQRSGLESESLASAVFAACSDGNGNLTAFLSMAAGTTGTVVGRNDYDPFGRRITSTLPTNFCPIGFSSKYTDGETGLVYYGYRYMSTELGRWLSRDPIGITGGLNLYGMVGNNPINKWDRLGLTDQPRVSPIEGGDPFDVKVKVNECEVVIIEGHGRTETINQFDPPKEPGCGYFMGQDTCESDATNATIPDEHKIPNLPGNPDTDDHENKPSRVTPDPVKDRQQWDGIRAAMKKLCPCCKEVTLVRIFIDPEGWDHWRTPWQWASSPPRESETKYKCDNLPQK